MIFCALCSVIAYLMLWKQVVGLRISRIKIWICGNKNILILSSSVLFNYKGEAGLQTKQFLNRMNRAWIVWHIIQLLKFLFFFIFCSISCWKNCMNSQNTMFWYFLMLFLIPVCHSYRHCVDIGLFLHLDDWMWLMYRGWITVVFKS